MRVEINDNCCATARRLIADGLNPDEVLEFYRGDVLCLSGKAGAFAKLRVREDADRGPEFVKWQPLLPERKAALRDQRKSKDALKPSDPTHAA